jgi:hypothetical protein
MLRVGMGCIVIKLVHNMRVLAFAVLLLASSVANNKRF